MEYISTPKSKYEVNKSTENYEVSKSSETEKSSKYEEWRKAAKEAEKNARKIRELRILQNIQFRTLIKKDDMGGENKCTEEKL
jgi:hypothetical protein